MGRARGTARRDVRGRALLLRWADRCRHRGQRALALARLPWLRRCRRLRPRDRLHLTGLDADQVVSRPARPGNRHGDHGLWRRRVNRRAAVGPLDEAFRERDRHRRRADDDRARNHLLYLDDCWLANRAGSTRGLEAGWIRTACRVGGADHNEERIARSSAAHAPVLPAWLVLCLNVTAGIGVIGQASLMIQDMFGVTAIAAAGFVGLISLFNMGGRIFWASLSDFIGRRTTYTIFFILGAVLYVLVPTFGHMHAIALFVLAVLVILSMYGGGFATIPAYLRDLFGTVEVGAIHGALLTAWSAAGVAGPVLVNYIREYQINHGVAKADAYSITMYIMASLLVVGLISNLAIRPVDERHHLEAQTAQN